MAKQEIAVVHHQRQRAAGLELATDEAVDVSDHRAQRIDRQMHVGEALPAGAVGGEERLVELEQDHRSRPHGEFATTMDHLRGTIAGVAHEAKAVVPGLDHLTLFPPDRDEAAVAAAEHGGADMDRVHRGAKRHVGRRVELAGVGEMLEQLSEADEALPVGQLLRQHLGRERLPDDGHRERLFENDSSKFLKKGAVRAEPRGPEMNAR